MSTASPWIRQIEQAFANAHEIPMWGHTPPFPLEQLCSKIQEQFSQFSWNSLKTDWAAPEKFLFGFGNTPLILTIELAPLSEPLFWVVAREDVAALTASLLTQENGKKGFSDPRLQEGYYRFLILEIFSQINLYPGLTPRITTRGELPRESCLCYDALWSISGKGMSGRLIVSPEFQTALRDNFKNSPASITNTAIADAAIITLAFEAGKSSLSYAVWENAKPGDLLLLDRWTYDPKEKKGSATVVAAEIPLFRARIKQGQIKIAEDAFFYEEQSSMDPKESDDEEFNLGEEEPSEEQHMWGAEGEQNEALEERLSAQEVPIVLTVELARIKISLNKLLKLRPGNMIDVNLHPDQRVNLTFQGKQIARGELVKIGETVGVKILDIGE